MKVIIQRCSKAILRIDNEIYSNINNGFVIFVGFKNNDTYDIIDYVVKKIVNLRIFDDKDGIMNKSILDMNGSILSVSQFTLYGNALKGNRPSYSDAMSGELATEYYDYFNNKLKETNINIKTGQFGSNMQVELINDGPVTIIIEKENKDA